MPNVYTVRDRDHSIRRLLTFKGAVEPVTVDFSPWAEDGGAVTTATWSVVSGSATISGQALASNSASAVVTTASQGASLIEVKGAGATHTKVFKLLIQARDPNVTEYDYGYLHG